MSIIAANNRSLTTEAFDALVAAYVILPLGPKTTGPARRLAPVGTTRKIVGQEGVVSPGQAPADVGQTKNASS